MMFLFSKSFFAKTSQPKIIQTLYSSTEIRRLVRLYTISSKTMSSSQVTPSSNVMVGVVQMTATPDKSETFQQASSLVRKAHELGAKVIFLPECCDYMGSNQEEASGLAEPVNGPTVCKFQKIAKTLNVWLSLGGMHIQTPGEERIYNSHIIISNLGNIAGIYRKIHLFDVDIPGQVRLSESSFTLPGPKIEPPVLTPCGKIGMAICYDMRFPELALSLVRQGAEILTYPSAFTVPTGMAHWHTILRTRAIETQSYVIAAAQVGKHHSKRSSFGHSIIVDPWGCVIAECSDKIGVAVAEIDLEYLRTRRLAVPVFNHRRYDLYGNLNIPIQDSPDQDQCYKFGQVTVPSASVFYRTSLSYAFVNKKPVVTGHILVSPIREVMRFGDLTPSEVADLFTTVQKVSKVIEQEHCCSSLTISIQDGPDAGQTIKHVHVHILPRRKGDFENNDEIYKELETHDKNVMATEWRTDAEMSEEASKLRQYFQS